MTRLARLGLIFWLIPALPGLALAGEVDILAVEAKPLPNGTWRFDVTVQHEDEGWDHYADGWEVIGPSGKLITRRVLRHPHVGENAFTRSKIGFSIPGHLQWVTVRGHDKIHAYGGTEKKVDLKNRPNPKDSVAEPEENQ
ncbi:MAG: hypothetical protein VX252_11165 [Myxococcota bacterium]|nr:hypothetical protein [Myxococcota bacterium]